MSAHWQETAGQVLWRATNPADAAELELYASRGVLVAIDGHETSPDGSPCVVYRETRSLVGAILEDLVAAGLAVKTDRTRAGRDGKMEPVYVAARYASEGSPGRRERS